jgi:hypothetical protein
MLYTCKGAYTLFTSQRERERERKESDKERRRVRERKYLFLKGLTGTNYLVVNRKTNGATTHSITINKI